MFFFFGQFRNTNTATVTAQKLNGGSLFLRSFFVQIFSSHFINTRHATITIVVILLSLISNKLALIYVGFTLHFLLQSSLLNECIQQMCAQGGHRYGTVGKGVDQIPI